MKQITIYTIKFHLSSFCKFQSPPEKTKLPSAPKVKKLFLKRERAKVWRIQSDLRHWHRFICCPIHSSRRRPQKDVSPLKTLPFPRPWEKVFPLAALTLNQPRKKTKKNQVLLSSHLPFFSRDNFSRILLFEQNNSTPLGRGNRLLKNVLFFSLTLSLCCCFVYETKLCENNTDELRVESGSVTAVVTIQEDVTEWIDKGVVSRHNGVRFCWFWYLNFVWRSIAVKLSQWASNIDRGQSTAVALVCQWHWIFFHVTFVCYYLFFIFYGLFECCQRGRLSEEYEPFYLSSVVSESRWSHISVPVFLLFTHRNFRDYGSLRIIHFCEILVFFLSQLQH